MVQNSIITKKTASNSEAVFLYSIIFRQLVFKFRYQKLTV